MGVYCKTFPGRHAPQLPPHVGRDRGMGIFRCLSNLWGACALLSRRPRASESSAPLPYYSLPCGAPCGCVVEASLAALPRPVVALA